MVCSTMACSHVILYDGICGLCDRLVGFVHKRDRDARFCFASLQSRFAREFLSTKSKNPKDQDTLLVIADYKGPSERLLSRAAAVLFILGELGGIWRHSQIFSVIPTLLLDIGYELMAKNRYRFFAKNDSCLLSDKDSGGGLSRFDK